MSFFSRFITTGFFAGLTYSLIEPHRLTVRKFDVKIPGLPREAKGLRIAQISDLHCGALGGNALLQDAVQICNAENVDTVMLTGDYISRRNSYAPFTLAEYWSKPELHYAQQMAKIIAHLQPRLGVFAVPGNHDHYNYRCDDISELMEKSGVTMLINQKVLLGGVLPLIGLDDLRGGRPKIREATKSTSASTAQIILSHNPRLMLALRGRNALVLAGHTHGGQVHLPATNFRVRPRDVRQTPFLRGWYQQSPTQMYVSSGLGSVHFPMRFRCPPEVVIFTLI